MGDWTALIIALVSVSVIVWIVLKLSAKAGANYVTRRTKVITTWDPWKVEGQFSVRDRYDFLIKHGDQNLLREFAQKFETPLRKEVGDQEVDRLLAINGDS